MALFKISRGLEADLATKKPSAVEGYCYFTPDTGKFYIDIATASAAVVGTNRIPVNADVADRLRNKPTAVFVTPDDDKSLLYLQISAGGQNSPPVHVPDATKDCAGALSAKAQTIGGVKTFSASPVFSAGATFNGAVALNGKTTIASAQSLYFGGNTYYISGGGVANLASAKIADTAEITGAVTAKSTLSASGLITASKGISSSDSITVSRSATSDIKVQVTNSANGKAVWLGVGSSGTNRGIYDVNGNRWALLINANNEVTLNGNATTATTADKLSTATAGSSTKPVYFSGGKPVVCSDTLANNISGTAAKVQLTNRTPSTAEWSYLPYVTSASSGSYNLYANNGLKYYTKAGTADSVGEGQIILGNSTAEKTVGNARGALVLYGTGTGGTWIYPSNSSSSNNVLYLPAGEGTLATLTSNVASATQLQTARTISISTDATGSATFNGTADITIGLTIANNAVTTNKIKDSSVTTVKIAAGNITTATIGNSAVTTDKIADNNITTAKVVDKAITNAKIDTAYIKIAGNQVALGADLAASTLRASLGLSNAMHFVGIAQVAITDGSTTDPKIDGYNVATDRLYGDVVVDKDTAYEYVWTSKGQWERLGPDGSYKTVQSPVTFGSVANGSGHQNTFISQIKQNENGVISVGTATLGTLTMNGQTYNGAANVTIGTLGAAYGGTGCTSLNASANALINSLTTSTSTPLDTDYYICQYAGGGTTTTSYHRRPTSMLWSYINSKLGTSAVGSSTLPIYWNGSKPVVCSNSLGVSITGNAATATKLATARTITVGNTSIKFDGSADVNISSPLKHAEYGSDVANTAGWYKVGTWPIDAYNSRNLVLQVISGYSNIASGILYLNVRRDADTALDLRALKWLARYGFKNNDFYWKDNGDCTFSLYVYQASTQWGRISIDILSEYNATSKTNIALQSNNTPESSAPTGGVASTDGGIVNYANSAGSIAWSNVSSKPSYYDAKAIKSITRSGTTFTYTCLDGTTGTFTQQDNDTTYTSLKNPYAITISLNGTSQGAYDGSAAKSINITPSAIGAAASSHTHTWSQISDRASLSISTSGTITASKVYNAVWNDYAEFRKAETIEPGRVIIEDTSGEMKISTERLQAGANIVSDTFGHAMGETDECKTPIAVAGRVLAYPLEDRNSYPLGAAVCTGPNGTVSLMTREEIMMYPERIVGVVSEIPEYDTWGTGKIVVNGRIWIKVK